MTNREWLNTLNDDEFCKWLFDDSGCYTEYNPYTHEHEYKFYSFYPTRKEIICRYNSSYDGMLEWLNEERNITK